MFVSSGRRLQHRNSKQPGYFAAKRPVKREHEQDSRLDSSGCGSDLVMEKVLFPCLFIQHFPALKHHPSSVWNYISCLYLLEEVIFSVI